jgi:N-acetylglucosamine kinase-like BadF-type ATPase
MGVESRSLLLGVEGGHTTQAVIATTTGEILGRGLGPPCNHHRVGIEAARQALRTAIEGAYAQVRARNSGLRALSEEASNWAQSGQIAAACFGLSGVDGSPDEALFSSWLTSLGCKFKFTIRNDSELILGGTREGWGVALISGTGSICVGRTKNGHVARVGGWGHVLGDEGSGYQIATEALRLATQASDGRGGSAMVLQAALTYWKLAEPRGLIDHVYGPDRSPEDVSGFASRVLDLAGRNDPVCREIVERAATHLAAHIDTVIKKLGFKDPPLALGGSVMRATFKKFILEKVTSPLGEVVIVNDPVQGAIATARRLFEAAHAA